MDFNLLELVDSGLWILIPALWFLGKILKNAGRIPDGAIPFLLCAAAILLCGIRQFAVTPPDCLIDVLMCLFSAVTQGIITAACAVFGNQLLRQGGELAGLMELSTDSNADSPAANAQTDDAESTHQNQ